jgi:hypothetical protein
MRRPSFLALGIAGFLGLGVVATGVVITEHSTPACSLEDTATSAASLVQVSESEPGAIPTAFFPTPLKSTGTERFTIREGSGEGAADGSTVDFQVSVYLGGNGDYLTGSSYDSSEPIRRIVESEGSDFFGKQLYCAKAGERFIITSEIADVFGPVPQDDTVSNASTVVLIVDVQNTYLPRAEGIRQPPLRGVPTVVTAPDGRHGLSFPQAPAPDNLIVHVTKKGSGPVIQENDRVVVHYTGAVWQTGRVFSSSFDQNLPSTLDVADGSVEGATKGVLSGVYQGLIGQTVGSQVMSVIPPGLGYPEGRNPQDVPEGATLVFVYDILGIE